MWIVILTALLLILISCGDSPPDLPTPVPNVGTIVIAGYIQPDPDSTIYTDSIGIVLDDDSLGFHVNPYIIDDIQVGLYNIRIYYLLSGETLSGRARSVEVLFDDTTDIQIRMAAGGVVVVSADYEDQTRDSLGVRLDGIDMGIDTAPRTIPNISDGMHKLVAYWTDDTTSLESRADDVEVVPSDKT